MRRGGDNKSAERKQTGRKWKRKVVGGVAVVRDDWRC